MKLPCRQPMRKYDDSGPSTEDTSPQIEEVNQSTDCSVEKVHPLD